MVQLLQEAGLHSPVFSMLKSNFRKAYEDSHDLLNDSLEILDKLYDEKDFDTRRDLLQNLRATMSLVNKNCNALAAGPDDGSGY